MQIRSAFNAVVAIVVLSTIAAASPHIAKDDLLETLAQKGVITMAEYEKLKAQRKTEVTMTTDDGFKFTSGDNSTSIQIGTLQQFDLADYDEEQREAVQRHRSAAFAHFDRRQLPDGLAIPRRIRVRRHVGNHRRYVAYTKYKPFTI